MDNNLLTINGVRGRLDANGNPELNLEDVARGLGFTQRQNKNGKIYESVRWERIAGYLRDFGFPPLAGERNLDAPTRGDGTGKVGLPEFVPENIFYKLCFKAENAAAVKFQDTVTDEVLPSIRKHGAYMTPEKIEEVLLNPDTVISLAMHLKEEQQKRTTLERTVEEQRPKVEYADAVAKSDGVILVRELAKILNQNGLDIGEKRLFQRLRDDGYLIKAEGRDRNRPTQKSMDLGLFRETETIIYHNTDKSPTSRFTPLVTGKGRIYFVNRYCPKEIADPEQLALD